MVLQQALVILQYSFVLNQKYCTFKEIDPLSATAKRIQSIWTIFWTAYNLSEPWINYTSLASKIFFRVKPIYPSNSVFDSLHLFFLTSSISKFSFCLPLNLFRSKKSAEIPLPTMTIIAAPKMCSKKSRFCELLNPFGSEAFKAASNGPKINVQYEIRWALPSPCPAENFLTLLLELKLLQGTSCGGKTTAWNPTFIMEEKTL